MEDVRSSDDLAGWLASCAGPQTGVRGITLATPCPQQLAVLDVSLGKDSPGCLHIFPAVLALARNMAGAARFGRLVGDENAAAMSLMAELKVTVVPTFIFYADGKEVGRYTGADRGALMANVMGSMDKVKFALPTPPVRKRLGVAEAKRIAAEARAREKAAGVASGW